MTASNWLVVTDFDGTLTEKDIGNELCIEVLGQKFYDFHGRYKRGLIDLKRLQQEMWQGFPMPELRFRERSAFHARMRAGVEEFLELCGARAIPVFVASCGLRAYIEAALESKIKPEARRAVHEIRCNDAVFGDAGIKEFIPPASDGSCPYPLDKGAWVDELRARYPDRKILGIGNGTSDRTLWPKVDVLAATEGLAEWCVREKVPYTPFNDFRDLLTLLE